MASFAIVRYLYTVFNRIDIAGIEPNEKLWPILKKKKKKITLKPALMDNHVVRIYYSYTSAVVVIYARPYNSCCPTTRRRYPRTDALMSVCPSVPLCDIRTGKCCTFVFFFFIIFDYAHVAPHTVFLPQPHSKKQSRVSRLMTGPCQHRRIPSPGQRNFL